MPLFCFSCHERVRPSLSLLIIADDEETGREKRLKTIFHPENEGMRDRAAKFHSLSFSLISFRLMRRRVRYTHSLSSKPFILFDDFCRRSHSPSGGGQVPRCSLLYCCRNHMFPSSRCTEFLTPAAASFSCCLPSCCKRKRTNRTINH